MPHNKTAIDSSNFFKWQILNNSYRRWWMNRSVVLISIEKLLSFFFLNQKIYTAKLLFFPNRNTVFSSFLVQIRSEWRCRMQLTRARGATRTCLPPPTTNGSPTTNGRLTAASSTWRSQAKRWRTKISSATKPNGVYLWHFPTPEKIVMPSSCHKLNFLRVRML